MGHNWVKVGSINAYVALNSIGKTTATEELAQLVELGFSTHQLLKAEAQNIL